MPVADVCSLCSLQATDPDSGLWGVVKYSIYGSGADLWVPQHLLMFISLMFSDCVWSFKSLECFKDPTDATPVDWNKPHEKKKTVAYVTSLTPKHRLFSEWENGRDVSSPQFITHSLQILKLVRIQLPITLHVVVRLAVRTSCTQEDPILFSFIRFQSHHTNSWNILDVLEQGSVLLLFSAPNLINPSQAF